ncbi:unnamed protein product [Tenebrio molitor]|nr:unnamed protein product [Tenebrio molitor]
MLMMGLDKYDWDVYTATYDRCIWLPPPAAPTRGARSRCPTRTSGAQESYHGIGRFYALRY